MCGAPIYRADQESDERMSWSDKCCVYAKRVQTDGGGDGGGDACDPTSRSEPSTVVQLAARAVFMTIARRQRRGSSAGACRVVEQKMRLQSVLLILLLTIDLPVAGSASAHHGPIPTALRDSIQAAMDDELIRVHCGDDQTWPELDYKLTFGKLTIYDVYQTCSITTESREPTHEALISLAPNEVASTSVTGNECYLRIGVRMLDQDVLKALAAESRGEVYRSPLIWEIERRRRLMERRNGYEASAVLGDCLLDFRKGEWRRLSNRCGYPIWAAGVWEAADPYADSAPELTCLVTRLAPRDDGYGASEAELVGTFVREEDALEYCDERGATLFPIR